MVLVSLYFMYLGCVFSFYIVFAEIYPENV